MPGQTEGWKDIGKDRWNDQQALFQRTLPATAGGPKYSSVLPMVKILQLQRFFSDFF